MFGLKTKLINKIDCYLSDNLDLLANSNKKSNAFVNLMTLFKIRAQIKKEFGNNSLQNPTAKKVNPYASLANFILADLMPSNLGNWMLVDPYLTSAQIEKKVIELIIHYFKAPKKITGNFSSGSTEGNIFASWLGKKYLISKNKTIEKTILLHNSLTHYSLEKAADIVGVKTKKIAVNRQKWNTDLADLRKQIETLYQDGFRGFLVPLTVGYTLTGTEDQVKEICLIFEKFKQKHNNIDFFIWMDAAFSGIGKIFTDKGFEPFKNKSIQLICTDFHKLLSVAYPASLILYREDLSKLIKNKIPYINQDDVTMLGSRPGTNVIATWMSFKSLNFVKLKKVFNKALTDKIIFLKKIEAENLNLEVISSADSTQACLACLDKKSEKVLKSKYKIETKSHKILFNDGEKKVKLAKLYFYPKL